MKTSQTSDRVSSIAARRAKTTGHDVLNIESAAEADTLAADIRSMAASLLRQDEHKGLRGIVRKMLGK